MNIFRMFGYVLTAGMLLAVSVQAGDLPRYSRGGGVIHGGNPTFAKAGADTINLMAASNDPTNNTDPRDGGNEPYFDGDFEDAQGNPAWNGWTHWDITQPTETHFLVSDFQQAVPGNYAAWCGDPAIPACDASDSVGGYGNYWHDMIEFRTDGSDDPNGALNTAVSTQVTVTATLQYDSEPGYDYSYLSYRFEGQNLGDMQSWDGSGTVSVNNSVTYSTGEYLNGTDIAIFFRFRSDGGWSDEDCSFPSAGACRIDDINVNLVNDGNTYDYFEDFQHGGVADDFGIWNTAFPDGVGDFAHIWKDLRDADPCNTNYTAQVAFLDDGQVVPGTGGSDCINWCYGPGGYIVSTTGGLAGPSDHLHVAIESPVMPWPVAKDAGAPDYDGIILTFGVYRHEDLSSDAPGMFYTWGVRSADTDGSAGNGVQAITEQGWRDRNYVYYGGPDYVRAGDDVTDLMFQGRDEVQVQLTCYELGWIWYWTGNDGYPAPFFDNVTVKVFPYNGPGMSAREIDLAQDNFPERGSIDPGDPGSHSVRFDMAKNISWNAHLRNDPGDSIRADIIPVRAGAGLTGNPELHYLLNPNPVFDPYRTAGMPDRGSVVGAPAGGVEFVPGQWQFDLPDTGFLFPGDVLHYYFYATDAIGGVGGADPQTSLMPADTTGFSTSFGDPMGYNSTFVVHALPSIWVDDSHPRVLFINDFANRGGENEWYTAFSDIGLLSGWDYDIYYVNGPSSGVGNGIGGRASSLLLKDYEVILYTSGDLGVNTIANGDFNNDAGDDVGTLTDWLDIGGKDMFLTGDELASDLDQAGAATSAFAEDYMGVRVWTNSISSSIGNQVTPLVKIIAGNPVFLGPLYTWYAYGGCPGINTFDGVEPMGGAFRLAEFTNPQGMPGFYSYSAATLNIRNPGPTESRIISMPVDLMNIYTDPSAPGSPFAARTMLLEYVLNYFGIWSDVPDPSPVLPGITFRAGNYPNPFNPRTTIEFSLPTAGHLKLSIFNVRGQLVKTLIDGPRPAGTGQTVVWDGSDNLGSASASGVYFLEARSAGEVMTAKMTLLR
ncbi:MAG: FlgD immunoglobulin-like domain containing protein [Candidatus Krumholzibacteriota bacterium]